MNIRSKLMAATAMLLVSAIMMTTASFAWFTISTKPEVTDMTSKVTVNQNLEIALALPQDDGTAPLSPATPAADTSYTDNYYTWGNLIDLDAADLDNDFTLDEDNDIDTRENSVLDLISEVELRPMALTVTKEMTEDDPPVETGTKFYNFTAPEYSADGRVNEATGLVLEDTTTYGVGTIKDTTSNRNYGYYVDLWVRTNMSNGYLGLSTEAADRNTGGTMGTGSSVTCNNAFTQDNVTIAVKLLGSATEDGTAPELVEEETDYEPYTNAIVAAENTEGALSQNNFFAMTANTAYLIRVYVYLDGADITNAAAATAENIAATVDLQFMLYDASGNDMNLTSMDVSTLTNG